MSDLLSFPAIAYFSGVCYSKPGSSSQGNPDRPTTWKKEWSCADERHSGLDERNQEEKWI
jgi:hypothetical protein